MLINLTNHPLKTWSAAQICAAEKYGEIVDYPFPQVLPSATTEEIQALAEEIMHDLLSRYENTDITIHLMGEFTLCFSLLKLFEKNNIPCVASTTERVSVENEDGTKTSCFRFVQFRRYP